MGGQAAVCNQEFYTKVRSGAACTAQAACTAWAQPGAGAAAILMFVPSTPPALCVVHRTLRHAARSHAFPLLPAPTRPSIKFILPHSLLPAPPTHPPLARHSTQHRPTPHLNRPRTARW